MTTPAQPIIITGFMGAGKTTVAIALSRKLGCAMIDLDHFITERMGRTPQEIIDEDGEQLFRELETQALGDALETVGAQTIALGGGTWIQQENRALIAEHGGFTIWLDASFELCWKRIESSAGTRPLARVYEQAQELYQARSVFYQLADLHVAAGEGKRVELIVGEILSALPPTQRA
jgi:shikimate kinase